MSASWSKIQTLYRRFGLQFYRLKSINSLTPTYILATANGSHENITRIIKRQKSNDSYAAKKDCSKPISKAYNPEEVENGWYDWWVEQGIFQPTDRVASKGDKRQIFSMLLPPPNVTGYLHLGHALTGAIQDALIRWRRMNGDRTLWVPGTDHAGIATHVVVEKKLWREQKKTRYDLGREEFIEEVWKWKQGHGHKIAQQLRMLGLSLDWSREYFTMDERLSAAVKEAFCQLYDKGLIYRDKLMINWSCALRSSLSDIEVDRLTIEGPTFLKIPGLEEKVQFGVLFHFAYPVFNSDEKIIVATTRLETMLADTAVAVHPDDPRYSHLVGQMVVHPLDHGRLLPVIADRFVDMNFGTGAVKITPGHDDIDFEVGSRHDLPVIEVINDDGTICSSLELFNELHRFEARRKVKESLDQLGFYHGEKNHQTILPICSRSGDIVESRLKEQWFLNTSEMAQKAVKAVQTGQLKLTPAINGRIWIEALTNSKPWCLSRQLWWGHRIPVYTCQSSNQRVCAQSEAEAKRKLTTDYGVACPEVSQDEDVLDTWFSSSLLPFSVHSWPSSTKPGTPYTSEDLELYFPQSLLETGQDILFFWVARMVMLSLELTGKVPFKEVLLHGLIRDAQGRKMSKSLGNVIDPLDVIKGVTLQDLNRRLEQSNMDPAEVEVALEGQKKSFPKGITRCGADALRLTLLSYNLQNDNIHFDVNHAESKSRFCNKIWQAFRFITDKLEPGFVLEHPYKLRGSEDSTDMWILSRLSCLVQTCGSSFQDFSLHQAVTALQQFWHSEICDVYLEAVKPVFIGQDETRQKAVKQILVLCTRSFLTAAAPFMPFVCEELFQRLQVSCQPNQLLWAESISLAPYPQPEEYPWRDSTVESSMAQTLSVIHRVQSLRKEHNMYGAKAEILLETASTHMLEQVLKHQTCLLALCQGTRLHIINPEQTQDFQSCPSAPVNSDLKVFLKFQGNETSMEKERERIHKKMTSLNNSKTELTIKLATLESKGLRRQSQADKIRVKISTIESELQKLSEALAAPTSTER